MSHHPATVVDALHRNAGQAPDSVQFIFLGNDPNARVVTNADLLDHALRRVAVLRQLGIRPHDVVLLSHEHEPELVFWFLALVCCGAVPCLFPCPTAKTPPDAYAARLKSAIHRVHPRAIIAPRLPGVQSDGDEMSLWDIDTLESLGAGQRPSAAAPGGAEDIAFIQLSSGSTGRQKAVPVTHAAVVHMARMRTVSLGMSKSDVMVGWVPLYHDLGLIGGVLSPIASGFSSVIISPFQWLRRPVLMMRAIHEFGGSVCTMPNFAFTYCARRIADEEMDGIDLGGLRVLCNAAEPVRPESFEAFAAKFARWGFRREAFTVGYGMAENTLTATMTKPGCPIGIDRISKQRLRLENRAIAAEGGEADLTVVSCGAPILNVEIGIRSEAGHPLPDRSVGEVVVRSPALFHGYWSKGSDESDQLHGGWFHSGDLGYTVDGELYICGRKKDVIIVDGHNVFPEDLEQIAATVDGIRPGRVVVFGVHDESAGSERVVLAAEPKDESLTALKDVERSIRLRVHHEAGVQLSKVEFVPADWILKTTSGKLARWENRTKWLEQRRTESAVRA